MDCSNPVKDSSRMSLRELLQQVGTTRRQDLAYLQSLAEGAERTVFPQLEEREGGESTRKNEWTQVEARCSLEINSSPSQVDPAGFLEEVMASVPVCGLMFEGFPIHPTAVNNSKGMVNVARAFGGYVRNAEWNRRLLSFVDPSELEEALQKSVYTRGEATGFMKRLEEQMTRPCVSCYMRTGISGKLVRNPGAARKVLRRCLPVKPNSLPDWHRDLAEQIMDIETSSVSSAGAPYWKRKPLAMEEMMVAVMPLVFKAITDGTLDALYKEQPELFLCEIKNKLDRYDPTKLKDKCRPYDTIPFHWQALFSMLSQPFTHALRLFWEDPSGACANAYGFSWAHGGGARMMDWASKTKNGRLRFYVYGDDCDVYYREDGKLWRVSPDFRQMDGSVDRDTIQEVVNYVLEEFEKQHGPSQFWREVGKIWVDFASNPLFLIHGKKVWRKKQKDGLMTGVVGTTFFDTAKAAMAYSDFQQQYEFGRKDLVQEEAALRFFRDRGLEIKEGTWKPRQVLEHPTPGELVNENKFLGVQLKWVQGPQEVEPVPHLPWEDWLTLLASPRDDPADANERSAKSATNRERLWFDRLRGYLVTGAFSNPQALGVVNGLINRINSTSILMRVLADGGRGEKPEGHLVVGEDFRYPNSEGVPNRYWCENLYFTPENQWGLESQWVSVFPELCQKVTDFHKVWKPMKPVMRITDVCTPAVTPAKKFTEDPFQGAIVEESVFEVGFVEPPAPGEEEEGAVGGLPLFPVLREAPEMGPGNAEKSKKPDPKEVNARSSIRNVVATEAGLKIEEPKRLPSSSDLLETLFKAARPPPPLRKEWFERGNHGLSAEKWIPIAESPLYQWKDVLKQIHDYVGSGFSKLTVWRTPVLMLSTVAEKLGVPEAQAYKICRKEGFYVLGKQTRIVSRVPLDLAKDREAVQQQRQEKENISWSKVVGRSQKNVLKAVKRAEEKPAKMPKVALRVHKRISLRPPELLVGDLLQQCNKAVQMNRYKPQWRSRQIQVGNVQYAETELWLEKEDESELVVSLRGANTTFNKNEIAKWVLGQMSGEPLRANPETRKKTEQVKKRVEREREQGSSWEGAMFSDGVVVLDYKDGCWNPGEGFATLKSLGWSVESGRAVAPNANAPMRRGRESVNAFFLRTKKLLQSEELPYVMFNPPQNLSPQNASHDETPKEKAARKAPKLSPKA